MLLLNKGRRENKVLDDFLNRLVTQIAALNFRKLFCFVRGSSSYAQNPLLT